MRENDILHVRYELRSNLFGFSGFAPVQLEYLWIEGILHEIL